MHLSNRFVNATFSQFHAKRREEANKRKYLVIQAVTQASTCYIKDDGERF